MSVPFRERNPVVIGAISLAVLAGLLLASFKAASLPIIGGGDVYYAAFSEAGGLEPDDEVRIAGVRVGKVEDIELAGDHVRVSFRIEDGAEFGQESAAAIKVKTLLGSMFLAIEPAGDGQMDEGYEIPVERTTSPYDVVEAFSGLAETSAEIDTDQLAESLTTFADLTRNTPEEFRAALDGVSALSSNVAAKNEQINTLLQNLEKVSHVLDERDEDIIALMRGRRRPVPRAGEAPRGDPPAAGVHQQAVRRADGAGPAEPRGPRTRAGQPRERRAGAQQERGQHRQQPAADGALLPGLRQHARHRSVVRHLHPEPAARARRARPGTGGLSAC